MKAPCLTGVWGMFSIDLLTLNIVTRSASRPGRFTPEENICITCCVVNFMGPRAGLKVDGDENSWEVSWKVKVK
jgi:hypothetical protein